jgi:hypothetical protein
VLDLLYSRPEETSVSTTQYLAIAMRQGLKLYSITGESRASALHGYRLPAMVDTSWKFLRRSVRGSCICMRSRSG